MKEYNKYERRFIRILVPKSEYWPTCSPLTKEQIEYIDNEMVKGFYDETFMRSIIESLKIPQYDGKEWLKGIIKNDN